MNETANTKPNDFSAYPYLTKDQAEERKVKGQSNYVKKTYSKSYLSIFCGNVFTFFNLLGLLVSIALILVGAKLSQFFYVLIYLANITIGVTLEIRSKLTIEKLSLLSHNTVNVIRDNKIVEINPDDIVIDDIIELTSGSQIPTDSIILDGNIEVNESMLTGESVPVKKTVGDKIYAGSFIVSGNCIVKAELVGENTYVSKLTAKAKTYKKPHSELINSLYLIIKVISLLIIPIATCLILKQTLLQHVELADSVLRTSSVIIGMIPSGMILLTSMALAIGVIKLATYKTLVQDLYSLEMLARVDTICFDKTGTITDGNMKVENVISLVKDRNVDIDRIISSILSLDKNPNQTSQALIEKFGVKEYYKVESYIPFNSKRKMCAARINDCTYSFGAPEYVLSKTEYSFIEKQITELAEQGLRVLVFGATNTDINGDEIPNDFLPIHLITLSDNIRPDAYSTVEWFKNNNVTVKVISGDNPVTVSQIAGKVGIEGYKNYISLEGLSDEEVYKIANDYTVFGRVSPEQKAILVKAMKEKGHTVAMTGDGVNDILAMKESDCAITVASGSSATRNIANLVLLNNDFNCMPRVVHEGRRVINNVQCSSSLFLMKTIFTTVIAIITLLSAKLLYPFQLNQMITFEVFVIGFPSFFFSLQKNDALVQGKFIKQVFFRSVPSALLMVVSYAIIEIIALFMPTVSIGLLTTTEILAVTFAGVISFFFLCLPLNLYRSFLFGVNTFAVLVIAILAILFGIKALDFTCFMPLSENYIYLLILVGVIIIDIPLFILIRWIYKILHKV